MARKFARLLPVLLALVLLAVNLQVYVAHAHNWNGYHWNKGGNAIRMDEYNYASYSEAEAARQSAWNRIGILYNYRVYSHTDISVYDGNFGATGWSGLASLDGCCDWDWSCWCYQHINHGHARYNSYYGYGSWSRQFVFCQEVFHTYGFDHDNYGGCMDYNGTQNILVQHNINDFYNRYQGH